MGDVEFGSVTRQISLACVPEARLGDYVIVHAGFAIGRLDEAEAQETLDLLASI
jgi:hydrogenase expression/formation protein HypC